MEPARRHSTEASRHTDNLPQVADNLLQTADKLLRLMDMLLNPLDNLAPIAARQMGKGDKYPPIPGESLLFRATLTISSNRLCGGADTYLRLTKRAWCTRRLNPKDL